MVWGPLTLYLAITTAFAAETPPNMGNLNAILPLMNEPASSPPKAPAVNQQPQRPQQNTPPQNNKPQLQTLSGNMVPTLQQITPMSYKLYDVPNNYPPDGCSSNSYNSVTTLLPILSMTLELLDHSMESKKAFTVCELIKNYLAEAPPSQEKVMLLDKIKIVEEHLLLIKESNQNYNVPPPRGKTIIVFDKEVPGTDEQNCRETFGRLIQTAVNVYKETAKHPYCQPSGYVNENLYYPNDVVKPQKPYQFAVIYENPPSSYYKPDYSGITLLPELHGNHPGLDHLYPQLPPNSPNNGILQYMPIGQNPSNPYLPLLSNEKPHIDIIALIRQYYVQHPESPKSVNFVLELLKNFTGQPNDYNPSSPVNPYDVFQTYPSQPGVYNPVKLETYPGFPGSNIGQLQNYPGLYQNPDVNVLPYIPSNPGDIPGGVNVEPESPGLTHLYGVHSLPGYDNLVSPGGNGNPRPDVTQNKPELTLEILLSLLGHPEGTKPQLGFNPQLESKLLQYLHPDNGHSISQTVPGNPNYNSGDSNYVVYGPDGLPVKQNLLDYLKQVLPESQIRGYSDNLQPDYATLLRKVQQWLAMTNGNKLPSAQNNPNVIELTYVLKRPKPLIYRPIYYVKYRLPYQTFVHNFQNLILKKPGLRANPERVYQEVISVSNISDVSPSLKGVNKEDIMKLVFGNGTLVDARVVDIPDNVLNEQLEATRKMNAEVDPKVIEELSGNLDMNRSESEPKSGREHAWLRTPPPMENNEDLAVNVLSTPQSLSENLANTNLNRLVNDGSSAYPQVLGPSADSGDPNRPVNGQPRRGYTNPSE